MNSEFRRVAETVTDDLPLSTAIVETAQRFSDNGPTVAAKVFEAVVELERRVNALEQQA